MIHGVHQAKDRRVRTLNLVADVFLQEFLKPFLADRPRAGGIVARRRQLFAKFLRRGIPQLLLQHGTRSGKGPVTLRVLQLEGEGARPVRRFPLEKRRGGVLVRPAAEKAIAIAEAGEDLWHLGGMPEHVAKETDRHRFHPPLARDPSPKQQVAREGFVSHAEEIRHGEPRPDEEAPRADEFFEAAAVFRTDLEVVPEHAGLPIELKVAKLRCLLHQVEQPVEKFDEEKPILLKRAIPLAVPVRAGNIVREDFRRLHDSDFREPGHRRRGSRRREGCTPCPARLQARSPASASNRKSTSLRTRVAP